MKEKKTLFDLVNQFTDDVEDLHNWEQEADRAVLIIAADARDGGKVRAFGNDAFIEKGIFELLTRKETRHMRHRLTKALSLLMLQELEQLEQAKQASETQIPN